MVNHLPDNASCQFKAIMLLLDTDVISHVVTAMCFWTGRSVRGYDYPSPSPKLIMQDTTTIFLSLTHSPSHTPADFFLPLN